MIDPHNGVLFGNKKVLLHATTCKVKEARHKRPCNEWFHIYMKCANLQRKQTTSTPEARSGNVR